MGFQPRKSYAPPDERQEMGMFFYKMSMLFTLFRRMTRQYCLLSAFRRLERKNDLSLFSGPFNLT